jgi:hypothetical protein
MDVEQFVVGHLGSEFVLGTETHLDTQAVDLAGIGMLPVDIVVDFAGNLAARHPDSFVAVDSGNEIEVGHPDSLVAVDPGNEIEVDLLGILLDILEVADFDILETDNDFEIEHRLGSPAQGNLIARVGSRLPASGRLGLHHH